MRAFWPSSIFSLSCTWFLKFYQLFTFLYFFSSEIANQHQAQNYFLKINFDLDVLLNFKLFYLDFIHLLFYLFFISNHFTYFYSQWKYEIQLKKSIKFCITTFAYKNKIIVFFSLKLNAQSLQCIFCDFWYLLRYV